MNNYFVRRFDLESNSDTLEFYQKIEGDVSCVVWDASIVLAKYLEELCRKNPGILRNKNIIELGSGVGCVGITAACYGAKVLLTDLPETIPLLNKNIEANKFIWENAKGWAASAPLEWGKHVDDVLQPDIILMADCIYYKESIEVLIDTLKQLTSTNTRILLSQELRESETQKECWKYFQEVARKHFQFRLIPPSEQNSQFSSPEIVLFEISLAKL